MLPDYARQVQLKDVGETGQEVLGNSRVLVIGAGGLGSPVLQYLAGAGVGTLGIVDGDRLEASNLHRQPLYSRADVGELKVQLAQRAVLAINPAVRVERHALRLDAGNARQLIGKYDLVIDGTDNFRAKYLINDAAVLEGRPAVFASVYQYEGQLQVYKPDAAHACLRCLWPDAVADGVVGNCAQAGVLGPVPGAIGALQALLAIKILLNLKGQLAGELLLLDFASFSTTKVRAPRRAACLAPACALVQSLSDEADLEMEIDSLESARNAGLTLIDIRTVAEIRAAPSGLPHIAMEELLNDPAGLPQAGNRVLVCASGRRSLAAARALAVRGIAVRSAAGGLERIASARSAEAN